MTAKTTAITRELLSAEHPDLLASILDEGRTLSYAEGLVKGAARECQRIRDVEAQALPGHEALIATLKFDGQTTGSEAALQIVRAEKARADKLVASLRADTPKPLSYDEAPPPVSAKTPDASVSWDQVMPGHA